MTASKLLTRQMLENVPAPLMAELAGCSRSNLRRLVMEKKIAPSGKSGNTHVFDAFEVLASLREENDNESTPMKETQLAIRQEQLRRQRMDNDLREARLVSVEESEAFANLYAGYFVRGLESAKKKIGAILDPSTRKQLYDLVYQLRNDLADELSKFQAEIAAGEVERPEPKPTRRRRR